MTKRRHQTIADLAAIALCPSLIVLLISSLVYFLVMCIYRGGFTGRIGYIWFMFIIGTVGIARLSIQESRKYALGYAAALGGATFVVLSRFMTVQGPLAGITPIINGATIALVWFLADRITYDCTLIDEDADASGRGLLDGLTEEATDDQDSKQHATRKRGHQPGRTVLWLTAAALPVFGFGQMMLPNDERWQQSAMLALAVYLFAALSLLVATSFLGVRRYLRQRGVDMPANVSAAWLAGGVAMTAIMLLACFLLPQPGKMLANAELPKTIETPEWLKPSKYGWGGETANPKGTNPNDKNPGAATAPPQKPSEEQGQAGDGDSSKSSGEGGGKKEGEKGSGGKEKKGSGGDGEKGAGKSDVAKGEEKEKTAESGEKSKSEKSDQGQPKPSKEEIQAKSDQPKPAEEPQQSEKSEQPSPPPPEPPSPASDFMPSLGGLLKALIYIVLIGFLAAFAWFQRHEIAKAWEAFLAWLRGEETTAEEQSEAIAAAEATRSSMPFSAFRNPLGGRGDPREAVIVTYQAAEAWWREHGQPRKPDETPFEFSRRLRTSNPADRDALVRLTEAYNRIVYGNDTVQPPDLAAAAAVWKSFANQ